MSIYSKTSTAIKPKTDEAAESYTAEIIPWPDLSKVLKKEKKEASPRVRLNRKFLYYRERKIPILQFQKSGYDKLLKLLVKEISR